MPSAGRPSQRCCEACPAAVGEHEGESEPDASGSSESIGDELKYEHAKVVRTLARISEAACVVAIDRDDATDPPAIGRHWEW
jgi:hypothetical protein